MIKKIIAFLCIAVVLVGGVIFYWPQSLTKVIDKDVGIYIRHTERLFSESGTPILESANVEVHIEPGTEQYTEFMNLLSKYSYHRSLRTYFGDSSISGRGNESIGIYASPHSIHNNGLKEILIGTKVYHIDYWGNKNSESMIRDVKAYVQGKDL